MNKNKIMHTPNVRTLLSSAIAAAFAVAPPVFAQSDSSSATNSNLILEEIIVTAQKRTQDIQEVPVAVTALTQETLAVNKVVNVNDLSGLAPNTTVRPAVGGTNTPAFNMRGITSYGVVAGSDKQISIYLDGVYIGSPRGSIFSLPDIQQLEVLRGPQGTLFGRNATGGAISVRTRDPHGEFAIRQKVSSGSRDRLDYSTTVDTPEWNGFSAYLTYAHEERDGDIENLGAGAITDRTAIGLGTTTSPETLGAVDNESWFFSALYEPNDKFRVSYKYDYSTDNGTPRGNAIVTDLYPEGAGAGAPLISVLAAINADKLQNTKTTRPKAVNNAFSAVRDQTVEGHSLIAEYQFDSSLTLKNTLAYRKTELIQPADITGTSGWEVGFIGAFIPGPSGQPLDPDDRFCYACSQPYADGDQLSDEIQINYDSEIARVTAGLLYYESEDRSGSPVGSANTLFFAFFEDGAVPQSAQGISYNDAKSYAVYSQTEFHITNQIDLVGGLRYTKDEKSGDFVSGLVGSETTQSFDYSDDNVSYLIGVNYFLNDDIFIYAKNSTAFVSGGSVAGFDFAPEEANSYELGVKSNLMGGRIRSNLALFHVTYDNLQTSQGAQNVAGAENLGVLIVEGGELQAQGLELEVTGKISSSLTLGVTAGYQDVKYNEVTDLVFSTVGGDIFPNSSFEPTISPETSVNLSLGYKSQPLFADAFINAGVNVTWSDKQRLDSNPGRAANTPFGVAEFSPETTMVNARAALSSIPLGGSLTAEVAIWGRNLTDEDGLQFITNFGALVSGTFYEERSYGVDLTIDF
ncbi:TonB-dependent receptor [Halioxenophilus sp. WMMB6]|uniref:TonB-dependent receptor n=1 Tax=Halioxenophilus sp. WMMB6 TaxID=3073815 RepID=UPI00295F3F00|nr:TonB-dependent receptor [Halioxenophilus sp. WMMB6]